VLPRRTPAARHEHRQRQPPPFPSRGCGQLLTASVTRWSLFTDRAARQLGPLPAAEAKPPRYELPNRIRGAPFPSRTGESPAVGCCVLCAGVVLCALTLTEVPEKSEVAVLAAERKPFGRQLLGNNRLGFESSGSGAWELPSSKRAGLSLAPWKTRVWVPHSGQWPNRGPAIFLPPTLEPHAIDRITSYSARLHVVPVTALLMKSPGTPVLESVLQRRVVPLWYTSFPSLAGINPAPKSINLRIAVVCALTTRKYLLSRSTTAWAQTGSFAVGQVFFVQHIQSARVPIQFDSRETEAVCTEHKAQNCSVESAGCILTSTTSQVQFLDDTFSLRGCRRRLPKCWPDVAGPIRGKQQCFSPALLPDSSTAAGVRVACCHLPSSAPVWAGRRPAAKKAHHHLHRPANACRDPSSSPPLSARSTHVPTTVSKWNQGSSSRATQEVEASPRLSIAALLHAFAAFILNNTNFPTAHPFRPPLDLRHYTLRKQTPTPNTLSTSSLQTQAHIAVPVRRVHMLASLPCRG